MTPQLRHGDDHLVVSVPLHDLDPLVGRALAHWLREHDLDPATLVVGSAVERDAAINMLVWRERQPDGSVVRRWRLAPVAGDEQWPAPFPAEVRTHAEEREAVG